MVLDERRQRDNRRECVCCLTRSKEIEDEEDGYEEGAVSKYFRNYHAPAILSRIGKLVVVVIYGALLGFGIWVSSILNFDHIMSCIFQLNLRICHELTSNLGC